MVWRKVGECANTKKRSWTAWVILWSSVSYRSDEDTLSHAWAMCGVTVDEGAACEAALAYMVAGTPHAGAIAIAIGASWWWSLA
ncbi:hypothetical protein GO496_09080 [Acidovorax citrulli]|nr:hypothetical protein [Paracidovorax citrulli]